MLGTSQCPQHGSSLCCSGPPAIACGAASYGRGDQGLKGSGALNGKLPRVSRNGIMQDYMMPPSWPFLLVFGVLAFALLVAGNFIFPGKKWKDGDEDSESLEVKLIFCLWSANQLQIRDLSLQFLAEQRSDFKLPRSARARKRIEKR